ncbi:homogentisate phytyltransferase [Oculatella sp. FACHB-28]|uniref:homogentisate phytyltransferase n=1 Tax=Oculatella sp. FACHB-28 TaxID=2692845 RepID=UPI001687BC9A|nr:homogentisate phytyltransferase [Oculatella sp. FACHB-28]MBD2058368.1 homogentisate phytyltransferase [Oculatella sp. FACHB-28]
MSQISPQESSISSHRAAKSNLVQKHAPWLYAFWKFSRPHTVIGTSLSVLGLYAISWAIGNGEWQTESASIGDRLLPLLFAWIACLCGNIYIVGLNQLEDVAIDRVNKPHLPLASGEFSRREAWAIVIVTGVAALALSVWQGRFLAAMVWSSLAIGTAYSLPPIRLKRFPFWASLCIFTVRGAIVNLGLFLHFSQQFEGIDGIPLSVWALTLFILVFTFAIAIFKDIPDLEGDRLYNISTFTLRLGQQTVFNLARWVLTVSYIAIILVGAFLPSTNAVFLIGTHLLTLFALWWQSFKVDLNDKQGKNVAGTLSYTAFYQFIWKLFFLEYFIFPIACLLV